ncbi:site-specific DNA-methyltransferase [Glutamicibacter sp. X7]
MSQQRLQLTWYNKDKALIPTETGKYGYTWVDPSDPRYCETHTLIYSDYVQGAQSPKTEDFEYSDRADLEPQDDNLLILGESGDVLEALTGVPELADKYVGKVKLVYIDPPFNTAQTFPSYEDNLEHSIWLTMMRDRLLHLKKLLAGNGSIWVHLDDVEVHRMRVLLDEVFGADRFIATVVWEKDKGRRNDTDISGAHDQILIYSPLGKQWKNERNLLPRLASQDARYQNPDNDPRGPWLQGDNGTAKSGTEKNRFPVTLPSGRVVTPKGRYWRFSPEGLAVARAEGRVWFGKDGDSLPVIKRYLTEVQTGLVPRTWWSADEAGHNQEAKRDHLNKMFSDVDTPFSTPKPERLLERIIHIGSNPGDIVLDVFAGSGTTAAVAQKMGRRWVTCELLETTFDTFTRPRLEKVVRDEDAGGVTMTMDRTLKATTLLPEKFEAKDLQEATKLLNAIATEDNIEENDAAAIKAVKRLLETGPSKTRNWRGGGGFQVAHLSPSCFDYDPELGRVIVTPEATGDVLVESVAANLGFYLLHPDDDYVFDGRRGNSLLKVVEGVATVEQVDWLVSQVQEGETIVLAATSVMDGVRQHLRRACKGSRVIAIPDDIFRYSEGGDR